MEDIYCQLVPNDEASNSCYDMLPRIGAFEVSYKGIILYSKMMSGAWPHFGSVAKFVGQMFKDAKTCTQAELKKKYTFNGSVNVATRGPSKNTAKSGFGMAKPAAT